MAKRRYEVIELNGKRFTLDMLEKAVELATFNRKGIYDAYDNPSSAKVAIYHEWSQWFSDNDGVCRVASHSCHQFTIEGYVTDKATGKRYWCYITKANNRCKEVEA